MGIEAMLEIGNGEYLDLEDRIIASKAIASFCAGSLELYCDYRLGQISRAEVDDIDQSLIDWFAAIEARMTTDLCLLSKVIWGYWDYADDEYARYVEETSNYLGTQNPADTTIKLMSEQEFLDACAHGRQTWTEPTGLQQVVDDLVRIFNQMQPPETWWYHPEVTPRHFHAFAKTLALAAKKGITKVRLNCE